MPDDFTPVVKYPAPSADVQIFKHKFFKRYVQPMLYELNPIYKECNYKITPSYDEVVDVLVGDGTHRIVNISGIPTEYAVVHIIEQLFKM